MRENDFSTKVVKNESDVIAFYDEYASSWDDRFGDLFTTHYFIERRWRSFVEAVDHCKIDNIAAVELGVGTGVYIERTAKMFSCITAIDGSEKMLRALRYKVEEKNISNVSVLRSNILQLEQIKDSSFDCVYFFGLLEHIIDVNLFTKEIGRILRKGGFVIGVTPNGNSPWYYLRRLIRGTNKHCSSDTYYTIKKIDMLFKPMGFKREYSAQWGAVPAGINHRAGRILAGLEPLLEMSCLKMFLGGLTFAYKFTPIK
jgi:ubiquinone/menaquinone biosynthesis C-methylase UbiE